MNLQKALVQIGSDLVSSSTQETIIGIGYLRELSQYASAAGIESDFELQRKQTTSGNLVRAILIRIYESNSHIKNQARACADQLIFHLGVKGEP